MGRKKRINLELDDRHMEELKRLMDRHGLNMANTLRLIISNAAAAPHNPTLK